MAEFHSAASVWGSCYCSRCRGLHNRAIINASRHACASPAVTSQNVCCQKGLLCTTQRSQSQFKTRRSVFTHMKSLFKSKQIQIRIHEQINSLSFSYLVFTHASLPLGYFIHLPTYLATGFRKKTLVEDERSKCIPLKLHLICCTHCCHNKCITLRGAYVLSWSEHIVRIPDFDGIHFL